MGHACVEEVYLRDESAQQLETTLAGMGRLVVERSQREREDSLMADGVAACKSQKGALGLLARAHIRRARPKDELVGKARDRRLG